MIYFGKRRPTYGDMQKAKTPVGDPCMSCQQPIKEDDDGFFLPHMSEKGPELKAWHRFCLIENILGPDWEKRYQELVG